MPIWNGSCYLLANVGLNDKHQPYFPGESEQRDWFTQKQILGNWNMSWQDDNATSVKVEVNRQKIISAEMIMFNNQDFGTKWFYGRITNLEWAAKECTIVHFVIDSFQTYMKEMSIGECYVEREHASNEWMTDGSPNYDVIPRTEEPVEISGHYATLKDKLFTDPVKIKLVASTPPGVAQRPSLYMYNGWPEGMQSFAALMDANGLSQIESVLSSYSLNIDAVVGVYLYQQPDASTSLRVVSGPSNVLAYGGGGEYQIKNAKLMLSPYQYFALDDFSGQHLDLYYENFARPNYCELKIVDSWGVRNAMSVLPVSYANAHLVYGDITFTSDLSAPISYGSDSFLQWLVQSTPSLLASTVGAIAVGPAAYANFGRAAVIAGGATAAAGAIGTGVVGASNTTGAHPTNGNDLAKFHNDKAIPTVTRMIPNKDTAIRVDQFFTMYGYATHKVKTPNMYTRPLWNYVKTQNCTVQGAFPSAHKQAIANMLDAGVTLWHVGRGAVIGDYSGDNRDYAAPARKGDILPWPAPSTGTVPPPIPDPGPPPEPGNDIQLPLANAWSSYRVSSEFNDYRPGIPAEIYHRGIDWACPMGTPIRASEAGTVATAVVGSTGWGVHVTITHSGNRRTIYAHMQSFTVAVGQAVVAGETIGFSNNTGASTGPHLHFQYENPIGTPVNPRQYLPGG